MRGKLILENGKIFEGEAFGYISNTIGEVVFNTGMTGYQEVLTDPSYYGQVVVMTYPLIGNYGMNLEDMESHGLKASGLIVREKCEASSNFRSELELDAYLKQHKMMGLEGIDTRALTRELRQCGTMKGIITTEDMSSHTIKQMLEHHDSVNAVAMVTTPSPYVILPLKAITTHVAVMDFGIKKSILDGFLERGCKLSVYPAYTKAELILKDNPDMVFLSNGPGNPEDLREIITEIRKMIGVKPITGICLGHQLLAIAMGGKTEKLKFGHRGCNHPVKDILSGKVTITSQNHGYHVTQVPKGFEITHVSLNDGSVEGMRHTGLSVYSVQYHPEASPGPQDSQFLFDTFIKASHGEVLYAAK